MLPGTVAGALFVLALVPGFIFLRDTRRHRESSGNLTTVEELFGLIGYGIAFTAPVAGIWIFVAAGSLAESARAPVDASGLRLLTASTVGILAGSVGISLLASRRYRRKHPVRSGESSWHDALLTFGTGAFAYASVTTLDNAVLSGSVETFDGAGKDGPRHIVLSGPLRSFTDNEEPEVVNADRALISEENIHSVTVSYFDEVTGERLEEFPPPTRARPPGRVARLVASAQSKLGRHRP